MDDLRAMGLVVAATAEQSYPTSDPDVLEPGVSALLSMHNDRIRVLARTLVGEPSSERHATFPMGSTEEERATALLRALEFLRACLLPVPAPPNPPPASATSPASPRAPAPPRPQRPNATRSARRSPPPIEVGLGPAFLYSKGLPGVAGLAQASLALRLGSSARAVSAVWAPWRSPSIEEPEGRAGISPWAGVLGANALVWKQPGLELSAGANMAVVMLSMKADASPGYLAQDATRWTIVPHVEAGATIPWRDGFRIGLSVMAGSSLYRPDIAFAGRRVGEWGALVIGGGAALQFRFY